MSTVRVEDPKIRLADLVDRASAGEEILITKGDLPVAKLVPPRQPHSVLDHRASSLGAVTQQLGPDDDLLGEMTDSII